MKRVLFACLLSAGVGFLSLSQEILFVRVVGFAYQSTPEAFAFVVGFFLLGIALGAQAGKRICASAADLRLAAGAVLLLAGSLDLVIPRIIPQVYVTAASVPPIALIIVLAAALKSVLFPIAHQLGSTATGPKVGTSISRVYASNIAGSTLGPLVTGFVLLEHFSAELCLVLVGVGTLLLAVSSLVRRPLIAAAGATWATSAALAVSIYPAQMLEQIVRVGAHGTPIAHVIEDRTGIVHVLRETAGGDSVYGGNVYDGRINTSLRVNSNYINRVYLLAALHPRPERVLVIGMSTGAWTWVLSTLPDVRVIDVVEISPLYLNLVRSYSAVASILDDRRITIHVDDGRRWLARHPGERYDLIVMNTSFYWRAYSTNLLSERYHRLVKDHLNDGGIVAFNSTGSPDAVWTADRVYPFVRRYMNFVYASDHDFVVTAPAHVPRLYNMRHGGVPLLDASDAADAQAVSRMMSIPFDTPEEISARSSRPLEIITDDNMITEYRYGRKGVLLPDLF